MTRQAGSRDKTGRRRRRQNSEGGVSSPWMWCCTQVRERMKPIRASFVGTWTRMRRVGVWSNPRARVHLHIYLLLI